jgi:diguanylate cyclase (GGDEF)-like protein
MTYIHWLEVHPASGTEELKTTLAQWGFSQTSRLEGSTLFVVADKPDPRWIPEKATAVLWWVKEGTPEQTSAVLSQRAGWVVRQSAPLGEIRDALLYLEGRIMDTDGWLKQLLHLATLDELLRPVLVQCLRLSAASAGAIWLRKDGAYYQRAGAGFAEAPLSQAEANRLVESGDAIAICPPENIGLLRLRNPEKGTGGTLEWLRELEPLLLNAWNLEHSRELSFKDDLTVAQNRRCLEAELPEVIRDAAAKSEAVALLFLDVDNLRLLNSKFGHPTGSKVLEVVALEARQLMRAQDRLYRYGGDEFCILMRSTNAKGASVLGERLIEALAVSDLEVGENRVPISLSVGIASFPSHADGADTLIERSDKALLKAKSLGKGRVVIFDGT